MASRSYINFDLSIERDRDNYRAHVLQSCAGEGSFEFSLPFAPHELENLILRMGHTRRGTRGRGADSDEVFAAKEFGSRLFGAIFQGDVYACLRASLEESQSNAQGLRVLLRLPPDLAHLPWEYLYNPAWNQFFSLSIDTPLVRYLELTPPIRPLAASLPLRVLVVIASPADYEPLDVEREWHDLQAGLEPLVARGLVVVDRLEKPSLLALQRKLRHTDYHIFHFIGHGVFDERKQDGLLVFSDEHGRGRPLSGQDLGTLLRDHRSLRLALLNACEGARAAKDDPFAGVAHRLVQMGLPAVIAMQFEISDAAAILFAEEFYTALADGYGVDAALGDARKAIFASGDSVEWGTPVLFSRTLDGRIFDWVATSPTRTESTPLAGTSIHTAQDVTTSNHPNVTQITQTSVTPAPTDLPSQSLSASEIAHLYEDGLSAYYLEEWDHACDCFRAVLDAHPAYRDTAARLKHVQQQLDLAQRYQQAHEYLESLQWQSALALLEALANEAPSYRDIAQRLQQARQQVHLQSLYADATRQSQSGAWQAVIDSFAQIAKLQPNCPDPQNLLATAHGRLAEQQQQETLAGYYRDALQVIGEQHWGEAVRLLEQIQTAQAGYRETPRLLAKARAEMARQKPPESTKLPWMIQNPQTLPDIEVLRGADPGAVARWAAEVLAGQDDHLRQGTLALTAGLSHQSLVSLLTRFLENEHEASALRARAAWALSKLAAQPDAALWRALQAARQPSNDLLLKSSATWTWCELGRFAELGLVKVPAGEFLMGSDPNMDADASDDEKPQHRLTLPAFYIAKYPVTVAEWRAYIQVSGRKWDHADDLRGSDNHPAVMVSWTEALAYAQWSGLTLPSEAEWEKAARGTDGRIYPWGNEWREKLANTSEYSAKGTTPVGQFSPGGDSPYQCADMTGNIFEWTRSQWNSYPYNPQDGREELQSNNLRVMHGGAYHNARSYVRCAFRINAIPEGRDLGSGFRVAVVSPIFPL
jgi:formylglycine-generating enzyme required for sulfatase activity